MFYTFILNEIRLIHHYKFLDELIIKAISAIRKSQKRPEETRTYDFIKIFLENCGIDDSLFWERMKYLEEKKDQETISAPIDQTSVINSPNNSYRLCKTS